MEMLAESDPAAPVLVAVLPKPVDLERARNGWYRIPLTSSSRRLAADFLAFYQTGAFPPEQRWAVHYCAPVRGYHIAVRRELIPEEPDHARAGDRYYRVDLGPLQALPRPIPSRRLRRITFIHTTLERLLAAQEINDLWIKTRAQQRLWELLSEARLEAECEYPLADEPFDTEDAPLSAVADLALLCQEGRIALILDGDTSGKTVAELRDPTYQFACAGWQAITVSTEAVLQGRADLSQLAALVARLGGLTPHSIA